MHTIHEIWDGIEFEQNQKVCKFGKEKLKLGKKGQAE